jgi:hypothetical protein
MTIVEITSGMLLAARANGLAKGGAGHCTRSGTP